MTLERAILEALDLNQGEPINDKMIHGFVTATVAPRPNITDVRAALLILEEKRQVVAVKDGDGVTVYSITPAGLARARS